MLQAARPLTDKLDSLEDNLRSELNVERFPRPKTWSAVEVSDRVIDDAAATDAGNSKATFAQHVQICTGIQ